MLIVIARFLMFGHFGVVGVEINTHMLLVLLLLR